MDIIDSIILGIIQGLTEFLPVSSSGHLELGKAILGDNYALEEGLLFTVVLHFATAFSTVVIFRKDVWEILSGLFQFRWNKEARFSVKIVLSMIPAVLVGVFFEEQLEAFFGGNIQFVGLMLIVTAILLYSADRTENAIAKVTFKNAFIIGISQAVAMLPGISRSGATISTSVLLGVDRGKATRFSFLMVVPLIFGKIAKDLTYGDLSFKSDQGVAMGVGFIVAFLTGLIACTWMIRLVRKNRLSYFAIYCFIVGLIAVTYSYFG